MSVLQYPEAMNAPDLQIWNNVAFDDGDIDESASIKASSWCPLQPILVNQSKTLDLDSWKENKSPVSLKSPVPIKPANSIGKPLKLLFKQGLLSPSLTNSKNVNESNRDEGKIDTEIEEIEMEINRLASKLETLRLEKAEQNLKITEKAEKNLKSTVKAEKTQGKIGGNLVANPNLKIQRRGVSMGPTEIIATEKAEKNLKTTEKAEETQRKIGGNLVANPKSKIQQRGVSMGPTEIIASVRSRQPVKPEITPIKSTQSRRKSCFYKLEETNEEKVTKERGGRSLSLSPTTRRSVLKTQSSRRGFTTVGSKKSVKKDEGVLSSIQPKKLFKEGEKSVGAKKPIKNGRVVASRYNQMSSLSTGIQKETDQRKSSLENGKKSASLVGKSPGFLPESDRSNVTEGRVKKRWEIPGDVLVNSPSSSILKMADLLPKIKTFRWTEECSPRDSGPAKRRAAELTAKKSYFAAESIELENSVCQALAFEED